MTEPAAENAGLDRIRGKRILMPGRAEVAGVFVSVTLDAAAGVSPLGVGAAADGVLVTLAVGGIADGALGNGWLILTEETTPLLKA